MDIKNISLGADNPKDAKKMILLALYVLDQRREILQSIDCFQVEEWFPKA